ncbi:hypothetical protein FRC03_007943 [Tulasnella sp. 419]|nr:hypothetical protein FRC03_007943 [Tulasnella sp. 419]
MLGLCKVKSLKHEGRKKRNPKAFNPEIPPHDRNVEVQPASVKAQRQATRLTNLPLHLLGIQPETLVEPPEQLKCRARLPRTLVKPGW